MHDHDDPDRCSCCGTMLAQYRAMLKELSKVREPAPTEMEGALIRLVSSVEGA